MAKKKSPKVIQTPSLFDRPEEAPVSVAEETPLLITKEEVIAESVPHEPKMPEPEKQPMKEPEKQAPPPGSAVLMDGSTISLGDECIITDDILTGLLKDAHKDKTFIIEKITPWIYCTSGTLVIAYQKDAPEKKTTGVGGKGIDANWFKKI